MPLKTPPFLLPVVLLFWGWQTGYLVVGLILGALLEAANWTKTRWEFADEDFTRIWTFCSLLLLVAAIYAFTSHDAGADVLSFLQSPTLAAQRHAGNSTAQAVAELIRWQPMVFFPFILAATYSARGGVPLYTISLILQRRWRKASKRPPSSERGPWVGMSYPYFAVCLFCASIQPSEDTVFFYALCILLAWALWPLRSPRFHPVSWAIVFLVAATLGYIGQRGINEGLRYLGGFNPSWLGRYSRERFDPRHTRTMIGQVGRLKSSGAIVIRVEAKEGGRVPTLLREASYRAYKGQTWYAGSLRNDFEGISPETNGTSWVLLPKTSAVPVSIACYLPGGTALLPLPRGSARLENLPAFVLQKNQFGAVYAQGPGLVIFDALYGGGPTIDSPTDDQADTSGIPRFERAALRQIVEELHLNHPTLREAMTAIQSFFSTKFTYSTWQELKPSRDAESPLSRFLLTTRSGHCEYFATATVLLLRELGFPARYAVGYAVHELSGKDKYVVRQRDAHAWCLVWNNGTWHDFDTTPGAWLEAEHERASPFQFLSDFWSRIAFEIAKIRWGQSHLRAYLLGTALPLLALLLFQIFRTRRKRHIHGGDGKFHPVWPGLDSEWYSLAEQLATQGLPRRPDEPVTQWLERAADDEKARNARESLRAVLGLHYRYRFDPAGLTEAERTELREQARACATALNR